MFDRTLVEHPQHLDSEPVHGNDCAQPTDQLPKAVTDIAWQAQVRLCARYRRLAARGLATNKVVVAIARELAGFVWAIARSVTSSGASAR